MGNYTSMNQKLPEKSTTDMNESKMIYEGREEQKFTNPLISQHEFEKKHFDRKNAEIDENNMKIILHTFDVLINQILQEKIAKIESGKEFPIGNKSSKTTIYNNNDSSNQTILNSFAQMLSTHLDDYLAICKRSGIVTSSTYKCSPEDFLEKFPENKNINNNNNNNNDNHHREMICTSKEYPVENKLINPYCLAEFPILNKCCNNDNDNDNNDNNNNNGSYLEEATKRMSLNVIENKNVLLQSTSNQTMDRNILNHNHNANDNIRINLPEILDQQDEVTILRLLIKLLSNKVRKLNDENLYLLQQISALNEINGELSSIIQHKFEK